VSEATKVRGERRLPPDGVIVEIEAHIDRLVRTYRPIRSVLNRQSPKDHNHASDAAARSFEVSQTACSVITVGLHPISCPWACVHTAV